MKVPLDALDALEEESDNSSSNQREVLEQE